MRFDPATGALALGGLSMMDYLAGLGFDVYLVDLPGYGLSGRPAAMGRPAADGQPFMRTRDAAAVVGQVVDFIRARRGVDRIDLMGWSWGTSTMGLYASTHNDRVNRLVLYAPQWISRTPSLIGANGGPLGAYRTVSRESAKDRWLKGVPDDKRADLIPPGWFEQWADATFATDAAGAAQSPPVLRAPNGVVADAQEYWQAGKALRENVVAVAGAILQADPAVDTVTLFTGGGGGRGAGGLQEIAAVNELVHGGPPVMLAGG